MAVKKKAKKTRTRIVRVTDKKSLRESIKLVRSRVLADIKEIRLLWAKGMSDIEVREELGLDWRAWKRRVKIMRNMPADQDVISVTRHYEKQHHKAIERLQVRMKQLQEAYDHANEEIEIIDHKIIDKKTKKPLVLYRRPRDLGLAASVSRDLANLDREILRTEQEFINLKQRLGLIEPAEPDENSMFDGAVIITAPNLMKAWQRRKELEQERKKAAMNGQKQLEDAVVVEGPDSSGGSKSKAAR